jgi:integrase
VCPEGRRGVLERLPRPCAGSGFARWRSRRLLPAAAKPTLELVGWERYARANDARARKAEVELEQARTGGAWTPPARVTFQEAAEAWHGRKSEALRPQTLLNYRSALDVWLLPVFAPCRSRRSNRPTWNRCARMAAEGKGQNTIANVAGVLRRVLDELVGDGQLQCNPAAVTVRGKRAGRRPAKIVVPTDEEVDRLLAAASVEARPVVELAASLGLRRAVSRLIEQGANILLVSKVAGHARPSVALDVYAHLFDEGLAEAAERFDPLARNTLQRRLRPRRRARADRRRL